MNEKKLPPLELQFELIYLDDDNREIVETAISQTHTIQKWQISQSFYTHSEDEDREINLDAAPFQEYEMFKIGNLFRITGSELVGMYVLKMKSDEWFTFKLIDL